MLVTAEYTPQTELIVHSLIWSVGAGSVHAYDEPSLGLTLLFR